MQLRKVFNRAYYALDAEKAICDISSSCDICTSLQDMPTRFFEQSTTVPAYIGSDFSADIVKRACQMILVVRENISAFTAAKLVDNEQAAVLKEGLLILFSQLRSGCGPSVKVRIDPAPGWRSLVAANALVNSGIDLEIGSEKNKNKNPIIDKAIRELHPEINRIDPWLKLSPTSMIASEMVDCLPGRFGPKEINSQGSSYLSMMRNSCLGNIETDSMLMRLVLSICLGGRLEPYILMCLSES